MDITHAMLTKYVTKRLSQGAKPSTVRYELVALGRMFTLAMRAGLVNTKPMLPTIKLDNVRKGWFEFEEFRRVVENLPEDLGYAISFAYVTGWRIGEIKNLTWSRVDLKAGVVRLESGESKSGEGRTFPLSAHPALERLMQEQRDRTSALERATGRIIPWVFHRDGEKIGLFVKSWKQACKMVGCPGKLVHDLRRTAVRNLVRAGIPEKVAMILTGHKTRDVLDRYDIVSEADLAEAVRKLVRG